MSILSTAIFLLIVYLAGAAGHNERLLSKATFVTSLLDSISGYVTGGLEETNVPKFAPQDIVTYSIASVYSDNLCASMTTAVAQRVNQCDKIAGNYTRTTAVATAKNVTTKSTKYKDAACTKAYGKPVIKTLSTACTLAGSNYVKSSLASSFSFHSSAAGLQIR